MNLKHLGDALDHWKGSVIELIGDKKLRVVPLFTDQQPWTQPHLDAYAKLLRRKPDEILKKDTPFSNSTRDAYFAIAGEDDLFLDPDTGVSPNTKRKKEHVMPTEIANLLSKSRSRMLLIYQHSSRKKDGIRERLELLRGSLKGCHMFAYDSGAVSMIVISLSRERIQEALTRVRSYLGPVAFARIIK